MQVNSDMKHNLIKLSVLTVALSCAVAALADPLDPLLTSVTVGAQSPDTINPGSNATYTVTVTRTNSGTMDIYFTTAGLPAGATASFSPNPLKFGIGLPNTKTATLTMSTTATTPQGSYTFSVTARDGGSFNTLTNTGTLDIGTDGKTSLSPQTLTLVDMEPDGSAKLSLKASASKPYILQATTSLSPSSWTTIATNTTDATGICVFMDLDAGNYSTRFYRTTVSN